MEEAGNGLAVVEWHLDALDWVVRGFGTAVHHLAEFPVEVFLDRVVVEVDRVLGHPVGLDRMVVVRRGGHIRAVRLRALRQRFVLLGRLAPHLGHHAVIARAFARRHFGGVDLEVLHAAAHVESEVEHPLLIVALCSELADHVFS